MAMRRESGQALVMVLVMMMIVQGVALAFLSRVNFEQRLAGASARSLAALYLAEAGVQKALQMLEDGAIAVHANGNFETLPGEPLGRGAFAIEAIEPSPGGQIAIVARGEVGGARRRVKVFVRLGPEALAYGVFAANNISLDGQSKTYLLPYRAGRGGCRCPGNLAAGAAIRFETVRVALNAFRGTRLVLREGAVTDRMLLESLPATPAGEGRIDLVLAGSAHLFSGVEHAPVTLDKLRRDVANLGVRGVRSRPALAAPSLDLAALRVLAEANTANAALNKAAGEEGAEAGLRSKSHSRYTLEEFEILLDYLKDHPKHILRGMILVEGDVHLDEGMKVTITDGGLVAIGDIVVGEGARLEVRHGAAARGLPGIVAWEGGSIEIEEKAVAIADGLVLADRDVDVTEGVLDVIGAVAAKNVLNRDGTVVVRYDSSVLATVGVRRAGKGVAEVLSWQELY